MMSLLFLIRGVICAVDCFPLFFYSDPLDNPIFPEQIKSDSCRFSPLQGDHITGACNIQRQQDNWKPKSQHSHDWK
jgi:hypothetical protein